MKKLDCQSRREAQRGNWAPRRSGRHVSLKSFLFVVMLLAACAPVNGISPTPVIVLDNGKQADVPAAATSTPPPLRFDLPTPGSAPVSSWRPPLYPLPWAISSYDHFYFARPIAADNVNWPLAEYRYGGIFFDNVVHTGVDIPDDEGTPILAAGPGTVVWAGWGLFTGSPLNKKDPYGQAVVIRHDFGYRGQTLYTVYAHMSAVHASMGQWVKTGEVIGYVGSTGQTTGPHLHFEVRLGENSFHHTYNPELWVAPPQGWGVLVGRLTDENNKPLHWYPLEVSMEPDGKPLYSMRTYGGGATNSDPYYNEDLVLSDLPAGIYKVALRYQSQRYQFWVEIFPGQVSYFTFRGRKGFSSGSPPVPSLGYLPVTETSTPLPLP